MDNKAEVKTDYLSQRIAINEGNQTVDLNEWVFANLVKPSSFECIVELCCGTGRQSERLVTLSNCQSLTCVDASQDAVDSIENSGFYDPAKMKLVRSEIDSFFQPDSKKNDLVFCSYGLYYSSQINTLLDQIYDNLNEDGSLIVVGPYGNNNKQLFDLLRSCGVEFNELVTHSSSFFMYQDVVKYGVVRYGAVDIRTLVNAVEWKDMDKVLNYWKNSTFYDADKEERVIGKLTKHFAEHDLFINEKHVMLAQLRKDV